MATAGIHAGTTIIVSTVRENEYFPVEISSSVSIDRGASAVIYKGELKLPTTVTTYAVALKIFPILLREHEQEMLRRELKAVSRVSHCYVLPFIGTSNFGGRTIIVTPFMKNGNMLQYLKTSPGIDRRGLIIQVAEAVYFLHTHAGVVHGDLKCENVLVSNGGSAQVADFGLSTIVDKEDSSATTMSVIRACSTFRFAAPELLLEPEDDQDLGEGYTTRRRSKTRESDVYAFGMLVLQAFTEKQPWAQLRNEAVMLKIVRRATPPHPGAGAIQAFTTAWWDVCGKCWQFEPRLRPTMHQIWVELNINADERPVSGGTGTVSESSFRYNGQRATLSGKRGTGEVKIPHNTTHLIVSGRRGVLSHKAPSPRSLNLNVAPEIVVSGVDLEAPPDTSLIDFLWNGTTSDRLHPHWTASPKPTMVPEFIAPDLFGRHMEVELPRNDKVQAEPSSLQSLRPRRLPRLLTDPPLKPSIAVPEVVLAPVPPETESEVDFSTLNSAYSSNLAVPGAPPIATSFNEPRNIVSDSLRLVHNVEVLPDTESQVDSSPSRRCKWNWSDLMNPENASPGFFGPREIPPSPRRR